MWFRVKNFRSTFLMSTGSNVNSFYNTVWKINYFMWFFFFKIAVCNVTLHPFIYNDLCSLPSISLFDHTRSLALEHCLYLLGFDSLLKSQNWRIDISFRTQSVLSVHDMNRYWLFDNVYVLFDKSRIKKTGKWMVMFYYSRWVKQSTNCLRVH